jgi:FKBP-type peptidyl-prolyl cis-trans isomerase 2
MVSFLEPGMIVENPARPDWGLGQVQSVAGDRVTVNFEHAGKLVINIVRVSLEPVPPGRAGVATDARQSPEGH